MSRVRLPFDRIFDDAAIGFAVVSAGNPNGDRIWDWNGESTVGRWLRVNESLCDLVGYSPEEMREMTFQDITTEETLPEDLRLMEELRVGAIRSYRLEKTYRRRDGSFLPVGLTVSVVRDQGSEPLYYVSQIKDRSVEVAHVEALERALIAAEYEASTMRSMLQSRSIREETEADAQLENAWAAMDRLIETIKESEPGT